MKPQYNPARFQVAPEFIRRHFQPEDRLCVSMIYHKTKEVKQELRTAQQVAGDAYQSHLRAANVGGASIYVAINPIKSDATGRTKEEIAEIRHVYLDIDEGGKTALDKVRASPDIPPPHFVMESSPGKYQVIWKVNGFNQEAAERTVRGMAREFGADPNVFDSARILRIPGFRNHKYELPHYVKEVPGDRADRIYTPADFPRYQDRDIPPPQFGSKSTERGPGQSEQSEKDFAYAMRQLEKGTAPEVIRRNIEEYRHQGNATGSMNHKHNPERYAADTVMKAQAKFISSPIQAPARSANTDRSR
jgi:hypothetical protein